MEDMKFYTLEEVRQIAKYKTKKTIYRAIKGGKLKAKRTPSGQYRISEEDLKEFIK